MRPEQLSVESRSPCTDRTGTGRQGLGSGRGRRVPAIDHRTVFPGATYSTSLMWYASA